MRIAQVAPLYERVPPPTYGGTERVVSHLTEELVRLGHQVTLFASGDSLTAAKLEPCSPRALRPDPTCREPIAPHLYMLEQVYRRAGEFDLIHCHTDYLGLAIGRESKTPTLITLHNRLDLTELAPLWRAHPEVHLVSISNAQRAPLPDLNWAATIHHGIAVEQSLFGEGTGDYLLFVGRMSPEKCPDRAIEIAQRAGLRLLMAAKVDEHDRDYFERVVQPRLSPPEVEYLGEVDERRKQELYRDAQGLLFPIDWPEPFGLVMIEALACGTPVIARNRGAVAEIVSHGETGFVGESDDDLIDAVRRLGEIDRRVCRAQAERRFSVAAMTRQYLDVYQRIVVHEPGRPGKSRPAQQLGSGAL